MTRETWRVVLESGDVREVQVAHDGDGYFRASCPGWHGFMSATTARVAVVRVASHGDRHPALGWPVAEILAPGEPSTAERVAKAETPLPETPRLFRLVRDLDATGVSGTWHVADGVLWHDGTCSVRWRTATRSTTVYDSLADVEKIHGHGGLTRVDWYEQATMKVCEHRWFMSLDGRRESCAFCRSSTHHEGPMITARDDGWARTHEDVEQLMRYTVPGARVTFEPVAKPGSTERNAGARRYLVSVPRIGHDPIQTADIYTLPVRIEPLARRVRELADHALTA